MMLSDQLIVGCNIYNEFYATKHTGRKLLWQLHMVWSTLTYSVLRSKLCVRAQRISKQIL
jgi:hypothetical protein